MPVAVVKLGSSIVAEDNGELRLSVVARITEEVAALHRSGVNVVIVTSGAIARGVQMLSLPVRPSAIENISTAPVRTPVISDGSAASRSPFCNTEIENSPSSVPQTVPRPPNTDVPPSTTAVMAASSYPVPASDFAWPRCAT